jgi:hypothetical protein
MEHTEQCSKAAEQHKQDVYNYVTDWPNHCHNCAGWGGFEYQYDPSAYGMSLGYMTEFDPCPECLEQGVCPRCGKEVWDEDDWDGLVICPECGWDESKPDTVPDKPECDCWIQDPAFRDGVCDEDVPF